MNYKQIKDDLAGYDVNTVDAYVYYLNNLSIAKNKDGSLKNKWMAYKKEAELISIFKRVAKDGLDFDGEHITLQSTGVSYDYIAYKNKMYQVYPESLIDVGLVYKEDLFTFEKESGNVIYQHVINNPFNQDEDNIVGGYCLIKNKRGEFLTLLSSENIDKHRKVAKTDYIWSIWSIWFHEMCLKTLIKKACKQYFADIYQNIETLDNENYDLEQPLGISVEQKAEVEKITNLEDLKKYYHDNKGKNAGVLQDFNKLVSKLEAEVESTFEGV